MCPQDAHAMEAYNAAHAQALANGLAEWEAQDAGDAAYVAAWGQSA